MQHEYDENKAIAEEGYAVSNDSFNPNVSSSSSAERHIEQREEADYGSSMPSRPVHYLSREDTSNDSRNGFKNLAND